MNRRLPAALIALAASGPAAAQEWNFSVTPYVWATDVGMDVTVRDRTLVDARIPFEDLLEDVESAVILRADAMRGAHGVAVDLFDVTVADDSGRIPLPGGSGDELVLDAEIGMTLLDVTGVYDPAGDGRGLALLYGVRIVGQEEDITATIGGGASGTSRRYRADDTFIDGLLGLRYSGALPGRWSYEFEADVSTGGTELTWSVNPSIGYTFGADGQYRLSAGYRYLAADFDTEPGVDMDMTLDGFLAGFRFAF
jgi:hypothetical protein